MAKLYANENFDFAIMRLKAPKVTLPTNWFG